MKWERAVLPVVTTAALLFIDAQFMVKFAQLGFLGFATGFETFIFALQIAKTALVAAVKDLRRASAAVLVDLYGAELLLLPVLLVVYLWLHIGTIPGVVDQLIEGWLVGVAFGGLPLAAYRMGRGMLKGARLADVLPTGMVSAELGVMLINGANSAASAHTGVHGILAFVVPGSGGISASSPEAFVASAAVYASLLLYALLDLHSDPPIDRAKALSLGIGATVLGAGWVAALSTFSIPMDILFLPPTMGIATTWWWMTRGK